MIVNVDFEKPYDIIEWNIVLVTLRLMNFPNIWIDWVRAFCFFLVLLFFINGQPSVWIKS